jgi:hypothetical protein
MAWLFYRKDYKNTTICHDVGRLFSYQSKTFSTRISRSCLWVLRGIFAQSHQTDILGQMQ